MKTIERALILEQILAELGAHWCPSTKELIESLALELSHPDALDSWIPYGSQQSRAQCLSPLLHIMSRNTPEAAIQSISRGILLGAEQQWVKLPSDGLPELAAFLNRLPAVIKQTITLSRELKSEWLDSAKAVIAFGSDDTLANISSKIRHDQVFQAHGHKLSCAVMFERPQAIALKTVVEQVAAYDQLGCLSPHQIYLAPQLMDQAHEIAAELAAEFTKFEETSPRSEASNAVALSIQHQRNLARINAAIDPLACGLWTSKDSTAWTLVLDSNSALRAGPAHRFLTICPLPTQASDLGPEIGYLSSVGVHPANQNNFEKLSNWRAPRLCAIEQLQHPSPFWHHDGRASLADLVRWQDRMDCP